MTMFKLLRGCPAPPGAWRDDGPAVLSDAAGAASQPLLCAATVLALVLWSASAAAQPAPQPARAQPADPQASVPPLVYRSPFSAYRPMADATPVPWRQANDLVGHIGGWRVYAREAQQAAGVVPAPDSPAAAGAKSVQTSAPVAPPAPVPLAPARTDGHKH